MKLLLTTVILLSALTGCTSKKYDYYFYHAPSEDYIKADTQKFRILFTGEVVNCYFFKDGKEFNTCDYYKSLKGITK